MVSRANDELRTALETHLARWGLKRFTADAAYFAWQRETLSVDDLHRLRTHVERKRSGDRGGDLAFYDLTAQPQILPVLYSQQYEYFTAIGPRVASRVGDARSILDFGCGVGILTCFYAERFPDRTVVGIDRSPLSIARAKEQAKVLGLQHVQFECLDLTQNHLPGTYDLIVTTHALVQSEQDPGLPSRTWMTFDRANDPQLQKGFETRTGVGLRLDCLSNALVQDGRMVVFEKTRQLSRRVPFQRGLAARGLALLERPEPIRYRLVEEVTDDGPLYVLGSRTNGSIEWDESPEPDDGPPFDPSVLTREQAGGDEPLYENHSPSAQEAWSKLRRRTVRKETTRSEPDGRQMHVEIGHATEGLYLYCANTFDQRQLVVVDPPRGELLEVYYREILDGTS